MSYIKLYSISIFYIICIHITWQEVHIRRVTDDENSINTQGFCKLDGHSSTACGTHVSLDQDITSTGRRAENSRSTAGAWGLAEEGRLEQRLVHRWLTGTTLCGWACQPVLSRRKPASAVRSEPRKGRW